jgi:hypothetical protein
VKRIAILAAAVAAGLCLAQSTDTITITVPAETVTALAHAFSAERAEVQQMAARMSHTLTPAEAPSTVQSYLGAKLAAIIADRVVRYSPADAPAKLSGEDDNARRNRYQQQILSSLVVH